MLDVNTWATSVSVLEIAALMMLYLLARTLRDN